MPRSAMRWLALALALLCLSAPQAEAGTAWLRTLPSGLAPRLVPNALWTGNYASSGGQDPQVDGVAYGQQPILAVGADAALNGVPQLTVPSTALMTEGDEFRIDGTGLSGVDGFSRLHIVDATHVDLCDGMNFGTGSGVCTLNTKLRPSVVTAGYSGSGGKIWFDETAIGNFDEHPDAYCDGLAGCTITLGAASNTGMWIDNVKFCLDTADDCVTVRGQSLNLTRAFGQWKGNFGWVVNVQSRAFFDRGGRLDGFANLFAIVTPKNGFQRKVGPLRLILNTNGTLQPSLFYVDNTDPLASDTACDGTKAKGAPGETSTACPFKTLLCAAGKTYSATSRREIHVAGTAAAGTMGTKYLETSTSAVSGCSIKTSPYPVRFVADGPVYITASTLSDGDGTGKTNVTPLNLPAGRVIFEGPFAFDNTFTQFKQSVSGGMAWWGQGTKVVDAAGAANTFLGTRGPAYGWTGSQEGGSVLEADATTFFGTGESTMDTVTAIGFSMYRNVAARTSIDLIQHGAIAGQKQPLTIFNYFGTLVNSNVNRRHKSQTVTIASLACITSYDGKTNQAPALDITFTSTPWDAALGQSPIGSSPLNLTMLSGGASNGLSSPYTSSGDANVYAVDELNDTGITASKMDMRLKSSYAYCNPDGSLTSTVKFQPGDIGFAWWESHPDYLQLNQPTENTYIQNHQGDGINIQPLLLQVGNATVLGGATNGVAAATMTTSGKSFTFGPGLVFLSPGDFISLPSGSDSTGAKTYAASASPPVPASSPLISRRVETVNAVTTGVTATYQNSANLLITAVTPGQTVYPGQEIFIGTNADMSKNVDLGKYIVSQTRSDEQGSVMGGKGLYVMSSVQNQGTSGVAMSLYGVGSGTLVAPFPVDQTTPMYANKGGQTKDLACVNCSLIADTNVTGLYAQWQAIQRQVFFANMTTTATKSVTNGNNTYPTLLRNNTDGFAAEASGYNDTVGPAVTSGNPTLFGPGQGAFRNVQATDNNNGNNLVTSGITYTPGATFSTATHLLASQLLGVSARNAAAVPFDANLIPRLPGAPIGAFVR